MADRAPGITSDQQEAKLLKEFQLRAREASECLNDWHREAEKAERYRANDQWEAEDKKRLQDRHQPALTFNQVHRVIQALCGREMMNRYGIRYSPRDFSDEHGSRLLTEWVRYHRTQSNAKYEESMAFMDLGTTGIGCTEIFTDFQDDPSGLVSVLRVPRREIYWDPLARRRNLLDARYVVRGRWMGRDDFEHTFKQDPRKLTSADGYSNLSAPDGVGKLEDASNSWMYLASHGRSYKQSRDEVLVVEYQYKEMHDALIFMRPDGVLDQVWKEQAPEVFAQLFGGQTPETVVQSMPRYYRCFVSGSKILQREQLPGRGFTYNFMTGFEDPESDTQRGRTWFGLMRIMTGPQDWFNKFMSLLIHMMSTASKGTMVVGPGVFENLTLAKKEYAQPGALLQANRADFRDKMEVIPPQGVPQSMFQALGMFGDMVPSLVGINPEYDLGQARDLRRVSGEALSQVKDAANAISAALVDSFAQYRQNLGMRYLEQLRKYIPEGQAVRIYNGFQAQDEMITRQEIFGRYDVVVDEAPDTRTSGEETIAQLMEQGNFQIMMTGGPGGAPLIPYSMLPSLFKGLSPEKREEMQQWTNMLTQAAMAQFAPPPPQGPPGQGGPPPGPPQ